jgi:hypothetical protein
MTPHPSVEGSFLTLLVLAHLQAIVVAWALALASVRDLPYLRERLPPGSGTCLWWRSFGDRRLWLYPLFTVGLTTLLGALLNASGNQIWHLLLRSSRLAQPAGALVRVAAGRAKTEIAARVLAATPAG